MQANDLTKREGYLGEGVFPDPKARLAWLDLLKVLGAFAVVITHIASIGWQVMDPSDAGWLVTSIYEIATRFAVPSFFMVSGAIMLNPKKHLTIRAMYVRYIPKIAILALLFSLGYCMFEWLLRGWPDWWSALRAVADGPYFIWYLWVLVGLYALTPLLRTISRREDLLSYAVALLAFFVIGKSTLNSMAPDSLLSTWMNNFILFSSGMEGIFYYLLGAWLISHRPTRSQGLIVVCIGVVSLAVAVALNHSDALAHGANLDYVTRDNLLIALYSVGVFEALRLRSAHLHRSALLSILTRAGMGIYLVHPFFRLTMESVELFAPAKTWLYSDPLLSVPLISLLIWVVSAVVTCLWIYATNNPGHRPHQSEKKPSPTPRHFAAKR